MSRVQIQPIPEDTARAAHAIFGRNNYYLAVGDQAHILFSNLLPLDPPEELKGIPLSMPMLYLFTTFQYIETLPDRRAVDAVRERIDWKYGLHLPMDFLEIEAAALCRFRRWLRKAPAGLQVFQCLIWRLSELSALCVDGNLKDDAIQIVDRLCWLNRTSEVWEAMSQALSALVTAQPEWLRSISQAHWYSRYSRFQTQWEAIFEKPNWEDFVLSIGSDGSYLLGEISKAGQPKLADLTEIKTLRQVWLDQFEQADGRLVWREACNECSLPERSMIQGK